MRWLHRFAADRGGATALEFAFVGPLLILLVLCALEFSIQLMTQLDLDNATANAARQVEIGAATTSSTFISDVCTNASILLVSCSAKLQVNVASGSSFSALTPATVSSSGTLSSTGFVPGSGGASVLIQVAYTRDYDVPWLTTLFGSPTLVSTRVVLNEPS